MRYSRAYNTSLQRMGEVQALNDLAKDKGQEMVFPISGKSIVNSLCRANVVLLSSHLEGYIEDLAELMLQCISKQNLRKDKLTDGFRYYLSKDLLDRLCGTNEPEKIAKIVEYLFKRDNHIWLGNVTFSSELNTQKFISGFSNPRFGTIRKFMTRFGYTSFQHDVKTLLRSNYQPCENMINNIVDRRNKIAHGDIDNMTIPTPKDIEDMLNLVGKFFEATDTAVGDWFEKELGCSIRS